METNINDIVKEYHNLNIFDSLQMWEIREGLKKGLTVDEVNLYADPKYNSHQMWEIRIGLVQNLTAEQVMQYAYPDLPENQMRDIRKKLKDEKREFSFSKDEELEF